MLLAIQVLAILGTTSIPNMAPTFSLITVSTTRGNSYHIFTSIFIHASIMHLLVNALALWFYVPPLERSIGTGRFFLVFLTAGILGGLTSLVVASSARYQLGSSGAVAGIMGTLLVVMLHGRRGQPQLYSAAILVTVGVSAIPAPSSPRVATSAHLGGLLSGVLMGFWCSRKVGKPL